MLPFANTLICGAHCGLFTRPAYGAYNPDRAEFADFREIILSEPNYLVASGQWGAPAMRWCNLYADPANNNVINPKAVIDLNVSGLGGLASGSIEVNRWYWRYFVARDDNASVADPSSYGWVYSKDQFQSTLPGFTYGARAGAVWLNSGGNFQRCSRMKDTTDYVWNNAPLVASGKTAGEGWQTLVFPPGALPDNTEKIVLLLQSLSGTGQVAINDDTNCTHPLFNRPQPLTTWVEPIEVSGYVGAIQWLSSCVDLEIRVKRYTDF